MHKKKNNERNKQQSEQKQESNEKESQETSFNQQKGMTCYCCGEKDHGSDKCPMRDKIPRSEWYVNKAMSNLQGDEEPDAIRAAAHEDINLIKMKVQTFKFN